MLAPDIALNTERLLLAAPSAAELPLVLQALREHEVGASLGWAPPADLEAVQAAHRRNLELWQRNEQFVLSACCADSGAFVGRVALSRARHPRDWKIAYWVMPEQGNRGYATEMARSATALALGALRGRQVEAVVAAANVASARVLEKSGFEPGREVAGGMRYRGRLVRGRHYRASA